MAGKKTSRLVVMNKQGGSLSSLSVERELLKEGAALTRRHTAGLLSGRSFESVVSPSAYSGYDDTFENGPLYEHFLPRSPASRTSSEGESGGVGVYEGQGLGEYGDVMVPDPGGGGGYSDERNRSVRYGSSRNGTRSEYLHVIASFTKNIGSEITGPVSCRGGGAFLSSTDVSMESEPLILLHGILAF